MGSKRKDVLEGIICAAFVCVLALSTPAGPMDAQQAPATALPSRISPKAQQLLDKAIQALGGSAFLNYKNISSSGRVFGFSNGEMAGVQPYQSLYEPPDKRRFTYGKSKPVTLINNGDEAWELDQYGLTHQLPEQVRNWKVANRYSLDNLLRLIIKESGVLVLDHGVDFVVNQPAYVIDITDAQDVQLRLYLRKDNYLPLRLTYRVANSSTQDWDEYVDDYSDYQRFDGIMTPMNISRSLNDERIGAVYRNKASYNVTIPANSFQPSK
ncbi:MAG: hypothetical protein EPN47_02640 [Acidobacteria bacterium]|nr:MAG: hypothetical protein EPN47_02640 [Acidobacteriota bacterium]